VESIAVENSERAKVPPRRQSPGPGLSTAAETGDDLDSTKKAVDDAAAVGGALWFSYLFVLFYLAVAAGAVTHADLFLENPVKLPFLNIDLPLLAFFFLAPILFLFAHGYTPMHLVVLTEKAKDYDQALREQIGADNPASDKLRRQLPSNIFIQYLAGPAKLRKSAFGYALGFVAWTTLAVAPVLLLLMMQLQFLPFHSSFITWTQRIVLVLDLALIWWLWGTIRSGRESNAPSFWGAFAKLAFGVALSFGAVLFAILSATFPDEWQESHFSRIDQLRVPTSVHDLVFNSPLDDITRHRFLPFSNTLVLTGFNIFEGLHIDDPKKDDRRDFIFGTRGRDLKGARFDFASLPRVDFAGAHLEGASLEWARFDRASFQIAQLQGASLYGARLQGASLVGAELQGASLEEAHLQGASLALAQLQGASLVDALFQGASFDNAQLQGATLHGAQLQGATIVFANLDAADLSRAFLWRADGGLTSGEDVELADTVWGPFWKDDSHKAQKWNDDAYQNIRKTIEALPAGERRIRLLRGLAASIATTPTKRSRPATQPLGLRLESRASSRRGTTRTIAKRLPRGSSRSSALAITRAFLFCAASHEHAYST
jgi:uncharacterized protein YjbI with pentapeptide repeats